jgi:transposase
MEILHPRCAGLDVHKDTVVAAVRCVSEPRHHEVRRFATTTTGLLALAEWLTSHGCTHVAVAASMLGACYHMLRDGVAYRDLGAAHFDHHDKTKTIGRLVRRLRDLGCEVEVKHAA